MAEPGSPIEMKVKSDGRIEPDFSEIWPQIDDVKGYLIPGQERWLYEAVRNLPNDAVIVEIGSYLGRSTTAMAFASLGTQRKIYAIDTFAGNDSDFIKGQNNVDWDGGEYLGVFKQNLETNDLLKYVTPIQETSSVAGTRWDKPIDFLFVDGSHEFDDVVSDFDLFFRWLKPGGLIAFHDVQPEWTGPHRAWNDVIRHRLYRPSHFFSIAYGRKPHDGQGFQGTVHTIIPVHNRRQLTLNCLKALHAQTILANMKIYVVDDGSSDGTEQMITEEFPQVILLKGDGNLWWTGAVAKAIEKIKSNLHKDDYFLLVNNDSTLNAETVEILVRESTRLNRAAVAPVAWCGTDAISTGWGEGTAKILNDFERQFTTMLLNENIVETKSIFGRCSLYPAEILEKLDNFDAVSFPHYHGDTDFALRAFKRGMKFYVIGSTCIRVREDQNSTGSHHEYRKKPQTFDAMVENMTSIKSIDNVKINWRYYSRHNSERCVINTLKIAWHSIKYWKPVHSALVTFAPLKPMFQFFWGVPGVLLRTMKRISRKLLQMAVRVGVSICRFGFRVWNKYRAK